MKTIEEILNTPVKLDKVHSNPDIFTDGDRFMYKNYSFSSLGLALEYYEDFKDDEETD